ncbi:50S ribosomal protein L9 [Acholeplasma granularum]|uniref:50S ribosomal protein L9 n=1 Tax=Acholeplasma granularum TaxID=264635 RepID=UPI0004AD445E|nr:50S ribosomal protein L9 [Acholeplasma granularum]
MKHKIFTFSAITIWVLSIILLALRLLTTTLDHISNISIITFAALLFATFLALLSIILAITNSYKRYINNLQNRLARWSKLSPRVNQVGDDAFNELPIGILVFDENLKEVKWVNNYAKVIFEERIVDRPIGEVSSALSDFLQGDDKTPITISIHEQKYEVIYKSEFQVVYLFNVSSREAVKREYQNNLPAIGIMNLDNFEENMTNFDISEQTSIKGEYLSAIADWVEEYSGYLKPYGDNRMVMLLKRKRLEEMMTNKFEILETIRDISTSYGIRVTLSVGIASWDLEYDELSDYAQNAIELAEKRGGDQAVVNIQNQKIAYFGAKLESITKSSRTNARLAAQMIQEIIDKSDQVYIMGHDQTDLDSFGSMIAALKMSLASPDTVPYLIIDEDKLDQTTIEVYNYLKQNDHPVIKHVITTNDALNKKTKDTLLLVLDTQNPTIVHSKELLEQKFKIGVIDHHRGNETSIQGDFTFIDPGASSTVELMMELFSFYAKDIKVDPFEASIMYGGLILDTNTFTYRTNVRTFEVASKLKDYGADAMLVKVWLRNDLSRIIEQNELLSHVEIFLDRFAIVKTNKQYKDRTFIAQVSELLLDIKGIDASFTIVLFEQNQVAVSARSFGAVNVQVLMEEMGGGGHLSSAATQIKDVSVDDAYNQLKHILELEYGGDNTPMKVILLEDVKGKGKKDQIIELAGGYANYLISSKLAVIANEENIKKLTEKKEQERIQAENYLELMKKLASEIDGKSVTLTIQIGVDGKRFGSVTTKQIVEAFQEKHGVVIDRKKLELATDIQSAGIYPVVVSLDKGVKATFEVNIIERREQS